MIKEQEVLVSVNLRNAKRYKSLGYLKDFNFKMCDKLEILVNIDDVSKNSKIRITAICSICNSENDLELSKYWRNYNRWGFYSCFKCKNKKKEMTNIKKYGVKSFSETKEFKDKFKKTCVEKYGVDHFMKMENSTIKDSIKSTNLERYGVTCPLSQDSIIESNRVWMSSDEFKESSKKSLLEKYGVDHYSKTDEFKKIISDNKELILSKIISTFKEKYGVDWISQTDSWKNNYSKNLKSIRSKIEKTCMERYGKSNVAQVEEIYNKIIETKIARGYIVPDYDLDDWNRYTRNCRKLTSKVKKELFESWNGIDYYDGEFIKGNFSYSHVSPSYPTIDHKISIYHGFVNGISPEEVSNIKNLCITKRSINSSKRTLIESEFLK